MKKKSIIRINEILKGISKEKREFVKNIYDINVGFGKLKLGKKFDRAITKKFGNVSLTRQKIVRVFNKITFEETFFNELRALRPIQVKESGEKVKKALQDRRDPFCEWQSKTPEDEFGRVRGKEVVTASNIAKYDKHHGLIIFKEHNPLKISKNAFLEAIEVSLEWFKRKNTANRKAIYPLIMWNCLWKSGASIVHAHMQLLLAEKRHFSRIEFLNLINNLYEANYNLSYFEAEYLAHNYLGLGKGNKAFNAYASITPLKEKEVRMQMNRLSKANVGKIFSILKSWRNKLGVESFNLVIALPPLEEQSSWSNFPIYASLIDRGSLESNTADIGGLEIATNARVVASDPYKVFNAIINSF